MRTSGADSLSRRRWYDTVVAYEWDDAKRMSIWSSMASISPKLPGLTSPALSPRSRSAEGKSGTWRQATSAAAFTSLSTSCGAETSES